MHAFIITYNGRATHDDDINTVHDLSDEEVIGKFDAVRCISVEQRQATAAHPGEPSNRSNDFDQSRVDNNIRYHTVDNSRIKLNLEVYERTVLNDGLLDECNRH